MQTRSKVLIAAAVAATLAVGGIAATATADPYGYWGGWRGPGMMGWNGSNTMGGRGYGMMGGYGYGMGRGGPGMMGWHGNMMGWGGPGMMGWHGNMMGWHGNMMGWRGGMGGWHHGSHHMGERIRAFAARYDTNGDGKITQAEIDANRADWFKKYDANNDGKLSIDEYQNLWLAAHRREMVRSFQRLDVNGAGAITEKEYQAPLAHIVQRFDRNGDGVLSYADLHARREHNRNWGMWHGRKNQDRMPMMDQDNDDNKAPQQQQPQQ